MIATYTPTPTGCGHRLAGDGLPCTNPNPHQPGRGCTYDAGTWVDAEDSGGGCG